MTAIQTLAAEAQPSLFLIAAGVVLVVLLIGAFWYGSRRRRRATAPPRPTEQNPLMHVRQTPDHPSFCSRWARLPVICPAAYARRCPAGHRPRPRLWCPPAGRLPPGQGCGAPVVRAVSRGRAWW
ncbi:DUF6479 family protein [Streptomyces sp. NPDC001549]|uniref:DUF6479 family protein n=1 Tax=Streptomyces sp. NPDC001549 TaxID=3364586 RepID=UPI0036BC2D16